ncbi:hypothetical protein MG293_000885 [Ovis ammon polii]|uniref:Uncharacterized protein n=1 Tax=Ovis ammon polii TaxID=230172 RepID=A0AAD4UR30_OVIAM|nr:hypothetical protein MG293_000885 [Ovis ammon polii]
MDYSLPSSSVHEIFQARVLEWGAIAFSNPFLLKFLKKIQSFKDMVYDLEQQDELANSQQEKKAAVDLVTYIDFQKVERADSLSPSKSQANFARGPLQPGTIAEGFQETQFQLNLSCTGKKVFRQWRKGKQLKRKAKKIQTMLQLIKANKKGGDEGLIG